MMSRKNRNNNSGFLFNDLMQLFANVSRRNQKLGILYVFLIFLSSLSEILSLGIVVTFMDGLTNPDKILSNQHLTWLLSFLGIDSSLNLIIWMSAFLVAIITFSNGLRLFSVRSQCFFAGNVANQISSQIYRKTVMQPYEFHISRNTGDLINSVMEDTRQLYISIILPTTMLVSNAFLIAAILVGVTLTNWQLAMISFSSVGIVYFSIYNLRKSLLRSNSSILVKSSHKQIKIVQESLGAIRDVLIERNHKFFQDKYVDADSRYRQATASNIFIAYIPRYVIETMSVVLIVVLALYFGRDGDFTRAVPLISAIAFASNRILPLLQQQFLSLSKIQGSRSSLTRILWSLNLPMRVSDTEPCHEVMAFKKQLCFDNVWFRYKSNSKWVLEDVSFTIEANTSVALVGSSGSGKSTTADLILGLLQAKRGVISVDGQSLNIETVKQWQNAIAHVPQNIFLVDGTILENIAFGIPEAKIDFDRVVQAAKLAQIDQFIQGLPGNYNCQVGERGSLISGGQRQRIGIARALYKQASVIVFDEATSSLDSETEREVMESIHELSRRFTIILIAHRMSTVKQCDRIIELANGRVVNQGTYKDLLEKSPTFRKMATT